MCADRSGPAGGSHGCQKTPPFLKEPAFGMAVRRAVARPAVGRRAGHKALEVFERICERWLKPAQRDAYADVGR